MSNVHSRRRRRTSGPSGRSSSGRSAKRRDKAVARDGPSAALFPGAKGPTCPAVGLGAMIAVGEALGSAADVRTCRITASVRGRQAARRPTATLERLARRLCRGGHEELTQVLAAIGSDHRFAIMMQLLEGPATYRSLQHRTGLKAGPLYHHVNQLRLASLLGPKSRDMYALTCAGRNVLLAVLCLGPLLKDRRPRPMPGA